MPMKSTTLAHVVFFLNYNKSFFFIFNDINFKIYVTKVVANDEVCEKIIEIG